jgi:PAS domain-containing protein
MASPADRIPSGPPSLPLILARELAANLATAMFLIDARGMLVFYNEAAELILGKPFAEVGEIDALEWGAMLQLSAPDGTPLGRGNSPAGIAFFQRRPAHHVLQARDHDGVIRVVEVTAYPLFGGVDELHGVVAVFWEDTPPETAAE